MSAPTLTEIRAQMETGKDDTSLQQIIDAENYDVTMRFGSHTSQVDEILVGGGMFLFPTRKVTTITSAKEIVGSTETTLTASDYQIVANGRLVERLTSGTLWTERVRLTYTPETDPRRKMVIIDLVRLAIQHNALKSESVGNYSSTSAEYQLERERILARLNAGGKLFA